MPSRKPYPSELSDGWALVAPWPILLAEDAGPREHPLPEYRTGCATWSAGAVWRAMPNDPKPSMRIDPTNVMSAPLTGTRSSNAGHARAASSC
jgi:hypothetical protein